MIELYLIAAFQMIMIPVMFYAFASCVSTIHFICDPEAFEEEE